MFGSKTDRQRPLEVCLILVCIGLTTLLHQVTGFKLVVLNLFYLPVVIAAFYLGRYRAGILALFCVISATVITVINLQSFAAYSSPIAVALAVTIWGAVMGLNSLLVGTLSDERTKTISELHDAYLGVVEVLSRYLNSADPKLHDRSRRVADLSVKVARQMKLASRETDDIRVAALLQDLEHVEITAKVIGKAIGDLGSRRLHSDEHTFQGSDLVHSLGTVLTGALPLLMTERPSFELEFATGTQKPCVAPFGARIIQTVRAYDSLMYGQDNVPMLSPAAVMEELKTDLEVEHHPAVLFALDQVLLSEPAPPVGPPKLEVSQELQEV